MKDSIKNIKIIDLKNSTESVIIQSGELDIDNKTIILNGNNLDILGQSKECFDISFETEDGCSYIAKKVSSFDSQTFIINASKNEKWLYRSDEIAIDTDTETNLDLVIAGLSWRDDLKMGAGVDAITGMACASAIKDFTIKGTQFKTSTENYSFIENKSDYEKLINVSVGGKFNIEGVNISASAEFMNSVKYSNTSITLLADFSITDIGYNEAESDKEYQLTDEAKELMKSNPSEFRNAYGDYFVAGSQNSARFTAVYVCEANSMEDLSKFKTSFGVDAPGVFEANGSAEFQQAVKKFNIRTEVKVFMYGIPSACPMGAPWTFEKIFEALDWFKKNNTPVASKIKLKHYKTINPNYSSFIQVVPSVFAELGFLFQRSWVISSMYHSLPTIYLPLFEERYILFDKELKAEKTYLAKNKEKRDYFKDKAEEISRDMEIVFARQKFYFEVLKGNDEPDRNKHFSAKKGIGSWIYGKTNSPNNAIQIESAYLIHSSEWEFAKKQEYTFEFRSYEPNKEYFIVGWKVIDHWADGTNGGWHKASDRIIGINSARVFVQSQLTRGFNWGVQFYYVNAADYQFGNG